MPSARPEPDARCRDPSRGHRVQVISLRSWQLVRHPLSSPPSRDSTWRSSTPTHRCWDESKLRRCGLPLALLRCPRPQLLYVQRSTKYGLGLFHGPRKVSCPHQILDGGAVFEERLHPAALVGVSGIKVVRHRFAADGAIDEVAERLAGERNDIPT